MNTIIDINGEIYELTRIKSVDGAVILTLVPFVGEPLILIANLKKSTSPIYTSTGNV